MENGKQTLESMSQAVWYNKWTMRKFLPYLSGDILEVGCGIGNFTDFLFHCGNVWAIDIEKEYIKQIKQPEKVKAKVGFGDIEKGKYFFSKRKFDSIICLNVLEHIKDDKKALKNMYNLLEKNGFLILIVPAYDFLFGEIDISIGHYRRYNKVKLSKLLTNIGFKIIKSRILNMFGAIGWWFAAKLFADNSVGKAKVKLFNAVAPVILPIEDLIEPPFGTSILIIAQKNKK